MTGEKFRAPEADCKTEWIIYRLQCTSCKKVYVGSSKKCANLRTHGHTRQIKESITRFGQHFGPGGPCEGHTYRMLIIDRPDVGDGELQEKMRKLLKSEGLWQRRLPECQAKNGGLVDRVEGKFLHQGRKV